MPSQSPSKANREARQFLEGLKLCHQIVSPRPLSLIKHPRDSRLVFIGCGLSRTDPIPEPTKIAKNLFLTVAMELQLPPPYLKNIRTTFRLGSGDDIDDKNWIVDYHYDRRVPLDGLRDDVPQNHLHVNAAPAGYENSDSPFRKLHLPTRRISLEQVVWHIVHDYGVKP